MYSVQEVLMYTNSDRSQWLGCMENSLRSRKYSVSTRRRYLSICERILDAFPNSDPKYLGKRDLEWFFAQMEKSGDCASTINQAISAGAFLWRAAFDLPFPVEVRPIADVHLPTVLSKNQAVNIIFEGCTEKTRLALAFAYSAGLRVSEVVALRLEDINRERGIIFIRSGKGRKDRVVPLARLVSALLDRYLERHPIKSWIFPSRKGGHITVRSLQHSMAIARSHAGFSSQVTMHTLRHSFATHLVERGENLMQVKELLGHSSLATLQQYIHLAEGGSASITSPLDSPIYL